MGKKNNLKKTDGGRGIFAILSDVYIVFILGLFPLYAPEGYYFLAEHKWYFFSRITAIYFVVMAAVWLFGKTKAITGKGSAEKSGEKYNIITLYRENIFQDARTAAFIFLIVCIISSVFSYEREVAVSGYSGWYMGLLAQACFALCFIFLSFSWKRNDFIFCAIFAAGSIVFLLGVLMRFHIDPFGMYNRLTEVQMFEFISTLGQTSWYSSYLCLVMPLAIVGYSYELNDLKIYFKYNWPKIFSLVTMVIGFMSTVTQNSDSAYIALAAYMSVFLWVAVSDVKMICRFLEVCIIALLSFKAMGLVIMSGSVYTPKLDAISVFIMQSPITWLILPALAGVYILMRKIYGSGRKKDGYMSASQGNAADKRGRMGVNDRIIRIVRILIVLFWVCSIAAGVTYIYLNTAGQLPEDLRSDNIYLIFGDGWGNHRGIEWRTAVGTFLQENLGRKLIGAGPDCFSYSAYLYYGDELERYFAGLVLQNCHNEWLNMLINCGILGLVSYAGIFLLMFIKFMKNGSRNPWVYGFAMAIAAYVSHNFFCYQQVICTSVIFVFMGMGDGLLRSGAERNI